MPAPVDPAPLTRTGAWWRQPVLWLGVLTFLASLAGCVWILLVSLQHADTPVDAAHTVFGVPASTHSSRGASP
jgi:uncharacterized membrane protein YccC